MKSEKNQNVSTKKVNILDKITKRSDYIRASTGSNKRTSSLHLQKFKREDEGIPRYGVTATKKLVLLLIEIKLKEDFVMR